TTLALHKVLRRNDLAEIATKLERVVTGNPGQVVHDLVVVLNAKLRGIGIRADVNSQVVQGDVRERIEARESECRHLVVVRRATKRNTGFIDQIAREV